MPVNSRDVSRIAFRYVWILAKFRWLLGSRVIVRPPHPAECATGFCFGMHLLQTFFKT